MSKIIIAILAFGAATCHLGFRNFAFAPERRGHHQPMFQGHHDFMGLFNRMSQIQGHIERRMARFAQPMISEVIVVEDKVEAAPASRYDACLDQLNVILNNFVTMAGLCLDKRWQETIPIFQKTMGLLAEDIKCFKDAHELIPRGEKIDPQCIIDHLNKAGEILQHIFEDLKRFDWNAIQHHIQELVETLADIRNC